MRTESAIREEIVVERAAYQAVANTEGAAALYDRTLRLRDLNEELNTALRGDAKPCPTCGELPHVHVKTPEFESHGQLVPAVYECGCLNCKAVRAPSAERADRVVVTYAATRAPSAAHAVAAWNRGDRFIKILPLTTSAPE